MPEDEKPRLIVVTKHLKTDFTLDRDIFTIGRNVASDIVIDDPMVSRQHARLQRTPDGYKITDLGSSNGLRAGSTPVTEKILRDGDVLSIGDTVSLKYIAPARETVPVPAIPPSYAGTTAAQAAPTFWSKLGISQRTAMICIGVIVVCAIAGFIYGFYFLPSDGPTSPTVSSPVKVSVQDTQYASSDQRAILNELGNPPSWILVDGAVEPGKEAHRIESWIYPGENTVCEFIDGKLTDRRTVSLEPAGESATTEISPAGLNGDMTLPEVRSVLNEEGEPVDPVEINNCPDCKAYHFPANRLVISFKDNTLLTAQTYVYMKGGE
jgi:hypothetical protein